MYSEQVTHATNVDSAGAVFWIASTKVFKGLAQIAETRHRTTLYPTADLTGVPHEVAAVARAAWNPENVAAFSAQMVALQMAERSKIEAEIAIVEAKRAELAALQAVVVAAPTPTGTPAA